MYVIIYVFFSKKDNIIILMFYEPVNLTATPIEKGLQASSALYQCQKKSCSQKKKKRLMKS